MPEFPIPRAPEPGEAVLAIEEAKAQREFDEHLTEVLLSRLRQSRFWNPPKMDAARAVLLPRVRANVNTQLIQCICSSDPLYGHNLSSRTVRYAREDTVEYKVRRIVLTIYPKAHKNFIRQKTIGCMGVIARAVYSFELPHIA